MASGALNVLIGVWLFVSAFAWPHDALELTNAWVLGILCTIFALVSMQVAQVRHANIVLAVWLFISAFALVHESTLTVWNNALCAVAIFFCSAAPPPREHRTV